MAGVDVQSGGGKRAVNREINMIPFIDLLMVTIAFLLITAVWVSYSRIEANAQVPSKNTGEVDPRTVTKDLHLYAKEESFVLAWKQAGTTVSEQTLPRKVGASDYPDLAKAIIASWKAHGVHSDPADKTVDRCVFHAADHMPFGEMVAVMDAVYAAKREMQLGPRRRKVPAFNVAFASR